MPFTSQLQAPPPRSSWETPLGEDEAEEPEEQLVLRRPEPRRRDTGRKELVPQPKPQPTVRPVFNPRTPIGASVVTGASSALGAEERPKTSVPLRPTRPAPPHPSRPQQSAEALQPPDEGSPPRMRHPEPPIRSVGIPGHGGAVSSDWGKRWRSEPGGYGWAQRRPDDKRPRVQGQGQQGSAPNMVNPLTPSGSKPVDQAPEQLTGAEDEVMLLDVPAAQALHLQVFRPELLRLPGIRRIVLDPPVTVSSSPGPGPRPWRAEIMGDSSALEKAHSLIERHLRIQVQLIGYESRPNLAAGGERCPVVVCGLQEALGEGGACAILAACSGAGGRVRCWQRGEGGMSRCLLENAEAAWWSRRLLDGRKIQHGSKTITVQVAFDEMATFEVERWRRGLLADLQKEAKRQLLDSELDGLLSQAPQLQEGEVRLQVLLAALASASADASAPQRVVQTAAAVQPVHALRGNAQAVEMYKVDQGAGTSARTQATWAAVCGQAPAQTSVSVGWQALEEAVTRELGKALKEVAAAEAPTGLRPPAAPSAQALQKSTEPPHPPPPVPPPPVPPPPVPPPPCGPPPPGPPQEQTVTRRPPMKTDWDPYLAESTSAT